jgi:hypothetical protein
MWRPTDYATKNSICCHLKSPFVSQICAHSGTAHTVLHDRTTRNALCAVTARPPSPPSSCLHPAATGYFCSFTTRDVFNAIWLFRKMLCIMCLCGRSLRGASRSPVGMCTEWNITLAHPLNATWIPNCLQKLALEPSLATQVSVHPAFFSIATAWTAELPVSRRAWQAFAFL